MGINEVRNLVDQVQGWLSYREGELLYNLAKNCSGKGVIVEIGSWKGKSTIWLAKGSKAGNNVSVYAIDPQSESNFEEFNKNIKAAKIDDIVFPIVKKSEDAAKSFNNPVEMIFIDGSHVYDDVKLDFDLWFPKVIDEGIMAFHDSGCLGWAGPKQVVDNYLFKSKNFRNVRFVRSITLGIKVEKISLPDVLNNRMHLFLRNAYAFALTKFHIGKTTNSVEER